MFILNRARDSYRKIILAVCLLMASPCIYAQYSGGEGGGYSSFPIGDETSAIRDTVSNKNLNISIFPNPLKRGEALYARVRGENPTSRMKVEVSDILGNVIHRSELSPSSRARVDLPSDKLLAGIYLITISGKNQKITLRLSLID